MSGRQLSTTLISPQGSPAASAGIPTKVRMKRERMTVGAPILRYRTMAESSEKRFNDRKRISEVLHR
jgi:hypothetical protein